MSAPFVTPPLPVSIGVLSSIWLLLLSGIFAINLFRNAHATKGREKEKEKKVTIEKVPEEQEVSAVVTDRNLGDVINFYTKGMVTIEKGEFRVSRILVDAGSVVNRMPIHLLEYMGAKLRKAGGMVIRTATNALAKIAYYADIRITIADVECDLRVYTLPKEYKPTYPLLLSRRWLQAVKATGNCSTGQYYIMNRTGFRVRIPVTNRD